MSFILAIRFPVFIYALNNPCTLGTGNQRGVDVPDMDTDGRNNRLGYNRGKPIRIGNDALICYSL